MKKNLIAFIVFLLLKFNPLNAQQFYNIKGETIENIQFPMVVIVYNSNSCSACMQYLCSYFKEKQNKHEIELAVMIPQDIISTMRHKTLLLEYYFKKEEMPLVVYDFNNSNQQSYIKKYKIQDFPCIIFFNDNSQNIQYFSYYQLFTTKSGIINKKTLRNINTFIKKNKL